MVGSFTVVKIVFAVAILCTTLFIHSPATMADGCLNYGDPNWNIGLLTANVSGGVATITVPDGMCPTQISFSSYNLPGGSILPFEAQQLTDNVTDTYGPGTHVVGPLKLACSWQTDVYVGGVQSTLNHDYGTKDLISFNAKENQTCTPPPPPPGQCKMTITKSVDKTNVAPGDTVEYTINFKNIGTADCTGGGVHIYDTLDSRLTYVSETHSSNDVVVGFNDGTTIYDAATRMLKWDANTLSPGEEGWVKFKATVGTPNSCSEVIPNKARISSVEYDNYNKYEESNEADITVAKTCSVPPPSCTATVAASTITSGQSTSLSWTSTNATSVTIDNGIGAVTPVASGTMSISPTTNTTYTITVAGAGSTSATCSASVTMGGSNPPPACTLAASPSTLAVGGGSSTLSWTTTNATAFTIDNGVGSVTPVASGTVAVSTTATVSYTGTATGPGGTITCASTITVPPPTTGCTSNCGGGCSGNCGGGGGYLPPHVLLTALPHVGNQPLTYLYLSQIPQTGLSLGPVGTAVYWSALIAWALALAYLVLFGAVPMANRSFRTFGLRVKEVLNAPAATATIIEERIHHIAPSVMVSAPALVVARASIAPKEQEPEAPRGYSSYDGFKSFAQGGSLSIDDIVKGLARSHAAPVVAVAPPEPAHVEAHNVEPVYENIEPIYQNVEPIMNEPIESTPVAVVPTNVRGFVAALIEGDRNAVFAGLRQYTRGAGSPEKLISDVACLLDDAYRARMDGTNSDADVVRLVARLDTPTLEKLVASLTTAIDSSYTTGVTGAKMALTRALGVLGA
jgi:uncharacterized repeat protein (TIGR01451 family)